MAIVKTVNIEVNSKNAQKDVKALEKSIEGVNIEAKEASKSTSGFIDGFSKGGKKASKGVGFVSKSFKGLGTAMKAAGIGIVIGLLAKLSEIFMQNQKVADAFSVIMESVSIVFNDFVSFIVDNTGPVIDFFKSIFENPKKSLKEFADAFKKNIQERFESYLDTLGFLASAVKKVFSGDFKGALEDVKKAGKESIDVFTGVNNSFDKGKEIIGKATKAVVEYTKKTIKSATENVNLAKAAELAAVRNQGLIEKFDRQAEKLRQTRDDESKSIEERIKANEELGKVLDEQEKAMKKNADLMVARAAAELSKNRQNIELQKAYQEALNEQAAIEAQITGFRSEQQTNVNSLLREQKDIQNELALIGKSERDIQKEELKQQFEERKQLIDKQVTDEVQKNELLLIAEQDFKTKLKELNDGFDAEDEETRKKKADLEKLRKEQTLEDAQNTFNQIANLAGKDSKVGKALALASATISGVEGVQNAYSTAQKSPITAVFPAYPVVQAALAAAVAAKNIATIKKTDPSGAGSTSIPSAAGGGGGGGVQAPSFNIVGATDTNQLADAISGQTQQPVQAFVVANDVTTAQSLENNIVEGATL